MTLDSKTTNVGKGLAILAVVALHILALPERALITEETKQWLLVIDQALRFSVPLFVFLSGYGLAKKYEQKLDLKDFYQKRVLKILPLFFLWTSGTYVISWILKLPFQTSLTDWWKVVFFGQSDYHFYFVPMILQLYLLFPVIRLMVTQSKLVGLIIFL